MKAEIDPGSLAFEVVKLHKSQICLLKSQNTIKVKIIRGKMCQTFTSNLKFIFKSLVFVQKQELELTKSNKLARLLVVLFLSVIRSAVGQATTSQGSGYFLLQLEQPGQYPPPPLPLNSLVYRRSLGMAKRAIT